ncbi:MAG: hypothetical protein QXL10_05945 [Candidatus Bathyarchaeia archaeon]
MGIHKKEYDKLQQAVRDMGLLSIDDFIEQQIWKVIEQHKVRLKQIEDCET